MTQLFSPKSISFRMIFILTLASWGWNIMVIETASSSLFKFSFIALSVLACLILVIAMIPWYGLKYVGLGIEDHFDKMLIPTTYLLLISNLFYLLKLQISVFNLFTCLVLLVILAINAILLTYHFRDPDKTPPSYFGADLYLNDLQGHPIKQEA
jgi:hypothetical protein